MENHKKFDEREITKFLWFPMTLKSNTKWLKSVVVRQVHSGPFQYYCPFTGKDCIHDGRWVSVEFVT